MEVYVDDMIVKTSKGKGLVGALDDILGSIKRYNMCLNPANFSFRVHARKFLCFMLTKRGIEANSDNCQAIVDMRSLTNVKEVQQNLYHDLAYK